MDGYREEGSSSQDRQYIPIVHEVGEGSSQAEETFRVQLVNDVTLFKKLMENPRFMEFLQSPLIAYQAQEYSPLSGHVEAIFEVPTVSQKGKEHSHARESCEAPKENLSVHEQVVKTPILQAIPDQLATHPSKCRIKWARDYVSGYASGFSTIHYTFWVFCMHGKTALKFGTTVVCLSNVPLTLSEVKVHAQKAQKAVACTVATAFLVNFISSQAVAESFAAQTIMNYCQLAEVPSDMISRLNSPSDGDPNSFVMEGMTAKGFNPARYAGRWFEVASLKRGFAGQGQEDCHCTQGVYSFDEKDKAIQVETFCVHGSPNGYITGIRGVVRCLSDADISMADTVEERQEMIATKCYLKFPFLPFIPKQPYDVIDTDYDTFALVSGAKDKSFVQIYSRTPNPGPEFIEKYRSYLAGKGYKASQIKDTPQDCETMSMDQLEQMMSMPGSQEALINRFPDLGLSRPVQFNPFTSLFDTFKKLVPLYFK
ncbi:hypothetical protein L7F22_000531 [Adiantum nelumboides]|nr:hypothetical protein [Adiantum nelumboides]